jgi:hypothetical protein
MIKMQYLYYLYCFISYIFHEKNLNPNYKYIQNKKHLNEVKNTTENENKINI